MAKFLAAWARASAFHPHCFGFEFLLVPYLCMRHQEVSTRTSLSEQTASIVPYPLPEEC